MEAAHLQPCHSPVAHADNGTGVLMETAMLRLYRRLPHGLTPGDMARLLGHGHRRYALPGKRAPRAQPARLERLRAVFGEQAEPLMFDDRSATARRRAHRERRRSRAHRGAACTTTHRSRAARSRARLDIQTGRSARSRANSTAIHARCGSADRTRTSSARGGLSGNRLARLRRHRRRFRTRDLGRRALDASTRAMSLAPLTYTIRSLERKNIDENT